MFSRDEILQFKNYCQRIIERPRPIQNQPHKIEGGRIWCEDWEIIECLKYFFNGPEMYANDPPPNRLKNNTLWSKEEIVVKAEHLMDTYMSAVDIIKHFEERRSRVYESSSST